MKRVVRQSCATSESSDMPAVRRTVVVKIHSVDYMTIEDDDSIFHTDNERSPEKKSIVKTFFEILRHFLETDRDRNKMAL